MNQNREKDSLISISYKMSHIDQYLQTVQSDINSLIQEETNWRQEQSSWRESTSSFIDTVDKNIRRQLKQIQLELIKRDAKCKEDIIQINDRLVYIGNIQKQNSLRIMQMKQRVDNLESILGSN